MIFYLGIYKVLGKNIRVNVKFSVCGEGSDKEQTTPAISWKWDSSPHGGLGKPILEITSFPREIMLQARS